MERQIMGEPGDGDRFAAMPEKEAVEGQRNFFGLWCSVMEATENPDDDKFGEVCDIIFKNEYPDGKEAVSWLFDELEKIQDQKFRGSVMDAVINSMEKYKYFYLTIGYALAQDYEATSAEAREQIEYLRERVRESGIFPLMAKRR